MLADVEPRCAAASWVASLQGQARTVSIPHSASALTNKLWPAETHFRYLPRPHPASSMSRFLALHLANALHCLDNERLRLGKLSRTKRVREPRVRYPRTNHESRLLRYRCSALACIAWIGCSVLHKSAAAGSPDTRHRAPPCLRAAVPPVPKLLSRS